MCNPMYIIMIIIMIIIDVSWAGFMMNLCDMWWFLLDCKPFPPFFSHNGTEVDACFVGSFCWEFWGWCVEMFGDPASLVDSQQLWYLLASKSMEKNGSNSNKAVGNSAQRQWTKELEVFTGALSTFFWDDGQVDYIGQCSFHCRISLMSMHQAVEVRSVSDSNST